MADVIGPNSYLPGQKIKVPHGAMCDEHPDRPAVCRVVGETDSFGSELMDMCQQCMDEHDNAPRSSDAKCDRCGAVGELLPTRDPDEGLTGPIYYYCFGCRTKQSEEARDEIIDSYCGADEPLGLDDEPEELDEN